MIFSSYSKGVRFSDKLHLLVQVFDFRGSLLTVRGDGWLVCISDERSDPRPSLVPVTLCEISILFSAFNPFLNFSSSSRPHVLLGCFRGQHLQLLLVMIQRRYIWSCYSRRPHSFFCTKEQSNALCCQGILYMLPSCRKLSQRVFWLRVMRWFSFPRFSKLLSPFPLREAPEIILWLFYFQGIILFALLSPGYKCLWPHPMHQGHFSPSCLYTAIKSLDSFSEFSVPSQYSRPLRKNALPIKWRREQIINNLILFIPNCCN